MTADDPSQDSTGERALVASIDAGTTSVRFIIFDERGHIVAKHGREFTQYFEQPGWQDQDPHEIMEKIHICIEEAVYELEHHSKGKYTRKDIKAIGVTNQRETTIVWDKKTGKALNNAIAWPDARTTHIVKELAKKHPDGANAVKKETGLPLSTYFASVKLRWLLDNVEEVKKANEEKRLMFGTMDSWIVYKLTGGKEHITDASNASRTMFMDLRRLAWDPKLCEFFGIEMDILPEIKSSCEVYGKIDDGILKGVDIAGIAGDQMAALVGQKALTKGQAKNTYGTGAFLLYNTGNQIVTSERGLLSTIAYQPGPGTDPVYALEGSIAVAGSAVKWLRDQMGLINDSNDVGTEASKVTDSGGIYFVTAFAGLLSPVWDATARGTIVGITGYTTREHICRATLEAACYQTEAVIRSMTEESGVEIKDLHVDGGMANSDEGMQIQADILGITVSRPAMRETTALGSALMAGAAKGLFGWDMARPETFDKVNAEGRDSFTPRIDEIERKKMIRGWERAVLRAKGWEEEGDG